MTRRKPTPAEALCKPESCFYCHHVMRTWYHNYAPDHFSTNDFGWACKYTPLKPTKISYVCEKFTTCWNYHTLDEFKYPFVVSMGNVDYVFDTQEEYQAQRNKWLVEIGGF